MNTVDRAAPTRRRDAGHTLIEVMVAATLFVAFIAGLYGASAQFYGLLDIQSERTAILTELNVARARLIADARGVSSIACTSSDVLELTTIAGGPVTTVEYKSDGTHLIRWESAENKTYYVADHVPSVACDTIAGGITVKVVFGGAPDVFALRVDLLEL